MNWTDIPSKYYFAPINTGFADAGQPTSRLIDFHRRRSGNLIGISYVGNVAIDHRHVTNNSTLYFGAVLEPWRQLASEIREGGSVPGIQLACRLPVGAASRKWKARSVTEYVAQVREQLGSLTQDDLGFIKDKFLEAATTASLAGFDVLQIHAAHGYFLSQLLSPSVASGPLREERLAWVVDLVQGVASSAPRTIVDVRISILEGITAQERASKDAAVSALAASAAQMISLSNGFYELDRHLIYPNTNEGHALYLPVAIDYAQRFPKKMWNAAGNIWDLRALPALPPNVSVSIGRALIADPQFIPRSLGGSPVRECHRHGKCHYYTRGVPHIECPVSEDLPPA